MLQFSELTLRKEGALGRFTQWNSKQVRQESRIYKYDAVLHCPLRIHRCWVNIDKHIWRTSAYACTGFRTPFQGCTLTQNRRSRLRDCHMKRPSRWQSHTRAQD